MSNNLFVKKENLITKRIDIIINILLLSSPILSIILLNLEILILLLTITVFLTITAIYIETKEERQYKDKIIINKPIVIDNGNIYLIFNKTSRLILIPIIILFIIGPTYNLSFDNIENIIIIYIMYIIALNKQLRKRKIKNLKQNKDNLYNLIHLKKTKYKTIRIKQINKKDNNIYIITFENGKEIEAIISNQYENYDELISILNQQSNS